MHSDLSPARAVVLRQARRDAAEATLFQFLRTLQRNLCLGDDEVAYLCAAAVEWFDPDQSGDYFQLPELDEWADTQPVEESPCQ